MSKDRTPEEAAALLELMVAAVTETVRTESIVQMLETEADIRERVFQDGKKVDGSPIGQYSTTPGYLSLSGARARYGSQLPLSGKTGRGKAKGGGYTGPTFASGKVRKSRYYEGGYSEFRRDVNRQSERIDLSLTGDMETSITTGKTEKGAAIGFSDPEKAELARNHEKRFGGAIFAASGEESDRLIEAITEAAKRAVRNLFT